MSEIKNFSRKVFYYETDGMRIAHHSNYIRWFEEARIWWLEEIGYGYDKMESEGVMIPVLSVGCKYHSPVRFNDTFRICLMITEFNGLRFKVVYKLYNDTTGKLSAEGESMHCFVSSDMRPLRTKNSHPEIYKIFKDAVGRKDWYEDE
ncbi:MAG: acyl-CoA thioesterase [Ruminococcus sp.]|nr:acyl-CoA thioesterase [Ruminococcus sp.]